MKKYILLLLSVPYFTNTTIAQKRIEQWDRYEFTHKANVKGNPFDVKFTATFTNSDTTLTTSGFYAGNGEFKVRFMPIERGEWTFVTQSTVPQLNGLQGAFECIPPTGNNHGLVKVADKVHFKYADGTRYYPIGTTSYDWAHIEGNNPDLTIQSLQESGFNKMRMLLIVQNFDKDYPEPKYFPFEIKSLTTDEKGKKVYEWDYNRFNPVYFDLVEKRIDALTKIGVEADLILFHPYDEGRWGFDRMPLDVCLRYLEYVTARMSSFRNVWWSLANEYNFLKEQPFENWEAFTHKVIESDPYGHLCSIHGSTANYYNYWEPEFTHCSIQDQAPVEDHGRAGTIRNIYQKPVIFDEVCYEGNMGSRWGNLSGEEMLYRMWQGVIAGTYVSHSECYMDEPNDYTHNFLARGGKFQGESWKRIRFMRDILEAMPNPLQLCDSSWDPYVSIAGKNYLMMYMGKKVQAEWKFDIPSRNPAYPRIKEGDRFKVEIIDTWNMTITEYPTLFEVTVGRYRAHDKFNRSIKLPKSPYLLLRITEYDK